MGQKELLEQAEARRRERELEDELTEQIIKIGREALAEQFNRFGRDKRMMWRLNRVCKRLRNRGRPI